MGVKSSAKRFTHLSGRLGGFSLCGKRLGRPVHKVVAGDERTDCPRCVEASEMLTKVPK
jgi:hypothetical protein